ncbi:hypothetical protein SEA_KILLIGREW_79 [Mycobacterium phage Killigrew]|nr:hypothetical protein SEA_KILLIGREW_79 [Mycobacterium phage Killigrew]
MIFTIAKPENRRELDSFVREIYDEFSASGDHMSRGHYAMLVRGGANALHRFGSIVVPRLREGMAEHVVIKLGDVPA